MSKDYTTLVDGATSAGADGAWFQPNGYAPGMNFINTAGTLGDTYLEASPDKTVTVSLALPLGASYLEGTYPYVRARKAANTPVATVYMSQPKR